MAGVALDCLKKIPEGMETFGLSDEMETELGIMASYGTGR